MTPDVTLRFERRLQHPIQRVWAAITEPDEIEAWWGRATVDLRPGGAMRIEWLNGDVTMPATITELDPPHVLEIEGCLLYTSPSPRDLSTSRMPSSA